MGGGREGKIIEGEREIQASSYGGSKSRGRKVQRREWSQPYCHSVVWGQMGPLPMVSMV